MLELFAFLGLASFICLAPILIYQGVLDIIKGYSDIKKALQYTFKSV